MKNTKQENNTAETYLPSKQKRIKMKQAENAEFMIKTMEKP